MIWTWNLLRNGMHMFGDEPFRKGDFAFVEYKGRKYRGVFFAFFRTFISSGLWVSCVELVLKTHLDFIKVEYIDRPFWSNVSKIRDRSIIEPMCHFEVPRPSILTLEVLFGRNSHELDYQYLSGMCGGGEYLKNRVFRLVHYWSQRCFDVPINPNSMFAWAFFEKNWLRKDQKIFFEKPWLKSFWGDIFPPKGFVRARNLKGLLGEQTELHAAKYPHPP